MSNKDDPQVDARGNCGHPPSGRRLKDRMAAITPLLLAIAVVLLIVAAVLSTISLRTLDKVDSNEFRVKRQTVALEKGCILLNNAIIQSSQITIRPKSASAVIVESIVRQMTPDERRRYVEASKQAGPPIIDLADCKKLAKDPDKIVAIPQSQPAPKKEG